MIMLQTSAPFTRLLQYLHFRADWNQRILAVMTYANSFIRVHSPPLSKSMLYAWNNPSLLITMTCGTVLEFEHGTHRDAFCTYAERATTVLPCVPRSLMYAKSRWGSQRSLTLRGR
jgi:hypothetical protein